MRCKRKKLFLPLVIALWAASTALSYGESFGSWSAKARQAIQQGDPTTALADYTKALKLWKAEDGEKAKYSALSERADLNEKLGHLDNAITDLSNVMAYDKRNASYFYRRGKLYLQEALTSKAISDFYQAVSLRLNYKEAYFERAKAYELQGDQAFAKEDYQSACRLGLAEACAGLKIQMKPAALKRHKSAEGFKLCRASLENCASKGQSYGFCVNRAQVCEDRPIDGCCPQACIGHFNELARQDSEAQSFRDTFVHSNKCANQ